MAKIVWSKEAKNDLRNIVAYISLDKPSTAQLYAMRIYEAVERLMDFPRSGRVIPEEGNENLRELIFGNYRIIYEIKAEVVEILTVHHASQILHLN